MALTEAGATVIAAGIGAAGTGASIANQAMQNRRSYKWSTKYLDYQNAMNIENWNRQNAYNLEMWNRENAYNSPAAQMQRYQAAGLNPNLVYGNGSSSAGLAGDVGSADIPGASAGQFQAADPGLGNAVPNALSVLSTLKNLQYQNSQIGLNNANTTYTGARTVTEGLNQAGIAKQNAWIDPLNQLESEVKKWNVTKAQADTLVQKIEAIKKNEEVNRIQYDLDFDRATRAIQIGTLNATLNNLKSEGAFLGLRNRYGSQQLSLGLNPAGDTSPWSGLFSFLGGSGSNGTSSNTWFNKFNSYGRNVRDNAKYWLNNYRMSNSGLLGYPGSNAWKKW